MLSEKRNKRFMSVKMWFLLECGTDWFGYTCVLYGRKIYETDIDVQTEDFPNVDKNKNAFKLQHLSPWLSGHNLRLPCRRSYVQALEQAGVTNSVAWCHTFVSC